jgi:hypothetical protein
MNDQPAGVTDAVDENENDSRPSSESDFAEIVLKPGQKCMARESLTSPIYLAKILKVRGPDDTVEEDSVHSEAKKRRGPQLSKSVKTQKRALPESPSTAAPNDGCECPESKLSQPTEVFIHFEGWSVKHDRSNPLPTCETASSAQRRSEHTEPSLSSSRFLSALLTGRLSLRRAPYAHAHFILASQSQRDGPGSFCPRQDNARELTKSAWHEQFLRVLRHPYAPTS